MRVFAIGFLHLKKSNTESFMQTAYVIDAVRTPIGKYGGILSGMRPDDLLAHVIKALLLRNPEVDPAAIEDVIAGAANQAGEDNRNVARMAALLAGLPATVPGTTVNRLCASGLQAIMDGARQVQCGDAGLIIAAGVESMTRAPFVMGKAEAGFSRQTAMFDTTMGWRFINKRLAAQYYPYTMGETAENIAKQWKISRQQQDEFALSSQQKYSAAKAGNKWEEEITVIEKTEKGLVSWVVNDEHPRETTLEKLAGLQPAFLKEGTVTAGNSSGINDGAAAMLIAGKAAVEKFQLEPIATVKAMAVAGVEPSIMGIGPVPATQKVLQKTGLTIKDIGLVELNEAFASQSLACIQELGLNASQININGGAIALGHPLGCSGVRISTTLLHEMRRSGVKHGLATMCVGVGQGASIIYEGV